MGRQTHFVSKSWYDFKIIPIDISRSAPSRTRSRDGFPVFVGAMFSPVEGAGPKFMAPNFHSSAERVYGIQTSITLPGGQVVTP